jgi:pyruvate dehydrogenase E2 component (dihydrolipoamide acetyltransferase)
MPVEFKLPELGENVEKGDVVRVLVTSGDKVAKDQPVLELETDKATIEVPSNVAGVVTEVRVKVGDKVSVGQTVFVIDEAGAPKDEAAAPAPPTPAAAQAAPQPAPAAPAPDAPTAPPTRPAPVVDIAAARPAAAVPAARVEPGDVVPAAPSTRRYARELGVEIREVAGSGPGGRIAQADVKEHVKARLASPGIVRMPAGALPDFTKWGQVDVKPMSNIRRKTAEHLSAAWTAPHVTHHDRADVTELETFRKTYGPRVEKAGGKLTVTAILLKVVAAGLDKYPQFAASVDMAAGTIVYKKYRHVGVAVDTPNGLLVPVIRDVDRKSITELAIELGAISERARDKKLTLEDMSGGVFTISNLGGIGGTAFSPIVNAPEVAILGVSRGATEPVWRGGAVVPREILPLSLSYDHRVIDGADAARFVRFIADALEQPLSVFL